MTDLVPRQDIERIVGVARHPTEHRARAVSAERTVYVLHSAECLALAEAGTRDLRACPYSVALARGIDQDEWADSEDQAVVVTTDPEWGLVPLGTPAPVTTASPPSEPTTLVKVAEWADPDENDGGWPYPTTYVKHQVTGELADRSRARLGAPAGSDVFLVESVESSGYSEFTQENIYGFTIAAGEERAEFEPRRGFPDGNLLVDLLHWLDGGR